MRAEQDPSQHDDQHRGEPVQAARPKAGIGLVAAKGALQRHYAAVQRAPEKESPIGAMPEAADHHRQNQVAVRSEEHTSELQSLMRTSYAVFCLKKKNKNI